MEDFIKFLKQQITIESDSLVITPDMDITEDVGMTSLDIMVVVLAIEQKYNKKLTIDSLMTVKTVRDLYNLVV